MEQLCIAALVAIICVVALWREVSLRRRLLEQEQGFRRRAVAHAEALPAAYLFCDEQGRISLWNAEYANLLGASAQLLRPGLPFRELLADVLKRGHILNAVGRETEWLAERATARSGSIRRDEVQLADGRWIMLEDRDTVTGGMVLIALDCTASKQQAEAHRLLFAESPLPMWVLEVGAMCIRSANAAAADQVGRSIEELQGSSLLPLFPEEEHDDVRQANLHNDGMDESADRVWRLLKADGSEILIRRHRRRLPGPEPLVLVILVDVTRPVMAWRELEAQTRALQAARLEAEAASRAKDIFLANMSHEIRTPLNGVVAVADVLARSTLTPAQAEKVELIRSSGQALDRLLSDVLDLTRIEAGLMDFEQQAFRFGGAVADAARLLKPKAEDKGLHLALDIQASADRPVEGDEVRVKQIVTNLVSNAIKFTAQGEVRVSARIDEDGACAIDVSDTGIGFSEDVAARLFHRFHQADGSITRRFGGSGLGLSICRELATRMGGAITCTSAPDVGSTFCVRLMLRPAQLAKAAPAAETPSVPDRLRVLLADDHPTNQRVGAMVLAEVDAEVTLAADGEEALQAYLNAPFDLVLMDMQMPVRDGLSATRAIRAHETAAGLARVPLIMLTANASNEHIALALSAGADRHVAKPFTAQALLSAVAHLLEPEPVENAA